MKRKIEDPTCFTESTYQGTHPALKVYFGYCFTKATLKYKSLLAKELAPLNIVSPQLGIMKLLDQLGPASQIGLGQDMGIDKASMVKFIDGLEKKKWVRRVPDKTDRRIKLVELTKAGIAAMEKITKIHQGVVNEFLSPLSKNERETLKELVSKLT